MYFMHFDNRCVLKVTRPCQRGAQHYVRTGQVDTREYDFQKTGLRIIWTRNK